MLDWNIILDYTEYRKTDKNVGLENDAIYGRLSLVATATYYIYGTNQTNANHGSALKVIMLAG